jgi:D-3-phosphoglycerate dehydrogenase
MENVILTPHMAFFSPASVSRLGVEVGRAAAAVLSGHWPKYVANPEVREKVSLGPYKEP